MYPIAKALADPLVRTMYLIVCLALMVVMTIWYRARLGRMAGGEAVRREQARIGTGAGSLGPALDFGRDIAAERYGQDVRQLQNTLYVLLGAWLVTNALAFGILFWADEVNRP
jgi:hypothetical protein